VEETAFWVALLIGRGRVFLVMQEKWLVVRYERPQRRAMRHGRATASDPAILGQHSQINAPKHRPTNYSALGHSLPPKIQGHPRHHRI